MKPGIIILSELVGELADRVQAIQAQYDPRMVAELPPHITISGSSGTGPIVPQTTDDELRTALAAIARNFEPFTVKLQPPIRFMHSTVVVMLIDPNGPIRALHEAIKQSGLRYERPKFTFTPHLTLSFYPELSRERERMLLGARPVDELRIESIQAYRATNLVTSRKVIDLQLSGHA
jgi:2'-5' RNA ligase